MLKYFNKRIIHVKEKSDLMKLLMFSMPFLKEFTEEFQNEINNHTGGFVGSLIMTTNPPGQTKATDDDSVPISFTAWVGKASIRPLINIHHRRFFLNLVNVDIALISKTFV